MSIARACCAMVWLSAFATSAAAQAAPPPRDDDSQARQNQSQQSSDGHGDVAKPKAYTISMKIVEGRGLLDRKELPRGAVVARLVPVLRETAAPNPPPAPASAPLNSSDSAAGSSVATIEVTQGDIWSLFVDTPQTTVLAAPTIQTPENRSAFLQIHNKKSFSYLVPTGEATFRLEKTPPRELGMKLEFTVKAIDGDPQSVDLSPLDVSQTSLDGRMTIEGVDLDAGKPILSTRSLNTEVRFKLGETRVITISANRDRQVLLLLKVNRAEN